MSRPFTRYRLYGIAFALAICSLVWLEYGSFARQRQLIRDLTRLNLVLSGERLAEFIEQSYYESAGDVLRRYIGSVQNHEERGGSGCLSTLLTPLHASGMFDGVVLLDAGGRRIASCGDSLKQDEANFGTLMALVESSEPGKVLPLAITRPPVFQLFYMRTKGAGVAIASADLAYAFRDRSNDAYVLGLPARARLVRIKEKPGPNAVLVRLPLIFPFWRIEVSPLEQKAPVDSPVIIFSALTSMVLLLLGFTIMLLTRANWRTWRLAQVREEFVRGVSHDLLTPVTNIRLYSEMLTKGLLSPQKSGEAHAVIFCEAQRLAELIARVLEFSKLKRGAKSFTSVESDACTLVENAIRTIENSACERRVAIEFKVPGKLPTVHCDPDAIEQCLVNLLDNAIKYSPVRGRIEISAEVKGRQLRIAVRDYGIGIPRHEKSRIFDEFYRASNARSDHGYGLGLYIVKSLMEAKHGQVEVTSELNSGSEFRLILPL